MNTVRIGTRGSRLAIAQTNIVVSALKKVDPKISCNIITISTKGDYDKRPLYSMDQKGIFEKEVDQAVVDGKADFAVHSLKDIPSDLSEELLIASIPKRAKPNDVLVNETKLKLSELPSKSVVGTSSLRRAIQIMRKRPDLVLKPIRGNVETRVKKSIGGEYDAVVLAEAGLNRLGMHDMISERFNIRDFIPAPGQGAIAIVCRKDNHQIINLLKKIEDPRTRLEIDTERAVLNKIEGGCRFPIGAIAVSDRDIKKITLYTGVFSADGSEAIKYKQTGSAKDPAKLGQRVANTLIKKGALEYALGWRDAVEEWNKKI